MTCYVLVMRQVDADRNRECISLPPRELATLSDHCKNNKKKTRPLINPYIYGSNKDTINLISFILSGINYKTKSNLHRIIYLKLEIIMLRFSGQTCFRRRFRWRRSSDHAIVFKFRIARELATFGRKKKSRHRFLRMYRVYRSVGQLHQCTLLVT